MVFYAVLLTGCCKSLTTAVNTMAALKISTNSDLANRKKNWIDFDAGKILEGNDLTEEFFNYCIEVANGKQTQNEINGYEEISIFKDGVTL